MTATATPPVNEGRAKWDAFEYPHIKYFEELFGSDKTKLDNKLRQDIRGFNLGLAKINDEQGFQRMVMNSNEIAHNLQDYYQKDVTNEKEAEPEKKEPEKKEPEQKEPEKKEPEKKEPEKVAEPDPAEKHIVKPKPAAAPQQEEEDDDDPTFL